MPSRRGYNALLPLVLAASALHAAEETEPDNGTDPTKQTQAVTLAYEHLELRDGFYRGTFKPQYKLPLGSRTSITLLVPFASTDLAGNEDYDLGDASLKLSHVYKLTRDQGIVLQGEVVFDTAAREELGGQASVFKGTVIYAKFLPRGAIFAPAFGFNDSFGPDGRPVRSFVADFYYVPKLRDRRYYMTIDPTMTLDRENDSEFASLAVTLGRVIGPAFGGSSQVYMKPGVFVGGDRPADWGIEIGYKVIGF
jgi:hypothetical protein